MQIYIGTKIKELRKRDGRTQEAMANALGVTNQAISRWESNIGYPDMEMLPAIANYFHVTIDELFGYSEDRTKKVESIRKKADEAINAQGDMTECVEMLRAAVEEFPSETDLLVKLGYALFQHGWKTYGARACAKDGADYGFMDTEYNSQNVYWQEALKAFEKSLEMNVSGSDRDGVINSMITLYQTMGLREKAIALAEKQNPLMMSRERLLPFACEGELQHRYQGEAIIELLVALKIMVMYTIAKRSMVNSNYGAEILLSLASLYETVFTDGDFGVYHYHIGEIYLFAAMYEYKYSKTAEYALEYFDKGFEHIKAYKDWSKDGGFCYSSPLLTKVQYPNTYAPVHLPADYWKGKHKLFPEEFWEKVRMNEKYAECFE